MNELSPAVLRGTAYHADFVAWTADQSRRLRRLQPAGVDWENLAEEVESLGKSDRRAAAGALKIVLEHLINWRFQPEKRSASWSDSIEGQRDRILRILEDSPSLAGLPAEVLSREYVRARRKALRDTGLAATIVPAESPFTADEALDPDFWPEPQDRGR